MLTEAQIDELTAHTRACGVAAVEIATESWSLRLEPGLAATAPPPAPPAPVTAKAPGMGRFRPLAQLGEAVTQGQTIGFLQTGALLRPLRAPAAGALSAWLAQPDELVGYAQELAVIQPRGNHAA